MLIILLESLQKGEKLYKVKNYDKAEELADYLYDSGELFEMKDVDRGSEITSIAEIKGGV